MSTWITDAGLLSYSLSSNSHSDIALDFSRLSYSPSRNLMSVYLIGVYLTGVHLMGANLIGMYLMGVHLTGVHLMKTSRFPLGRLVWI